MMKSYSILLFCVTLWASNFIIASVLVNYLDALTITFIRLLCIVCFLLFLAVGNFSFHIPSFKIIFLLILAAIFGVAINHFSFFKSMETTTPIVAAYILALTPIVTALINKMLFNERKTLHFWSGSLLSFLGVVIIVTFKSSTNLSFGVGELYSLLTMLSFAVFLVCIQTLSKYMNSITLTFTTTFIGMVVLSPFTSFLNLKEVVYIQWPILLLLSVSAIFVHGLSNLMWNKEMPKVGASVGALFLNLEPVITIVLAFIFLGEVASLTQLLGGLIVLIGIMLSLQLFERPFHTKHS